MIILTPQKIISKLEEYDITNEQFADEVGFNASYVSRVFNGRQSVSLKFLIASAEYFECDLVDLIVEVKC